MTPSYLKPYLDAARQHRGGFKSLLWASPQTQSARFDAFARLYDFAGKSLLDVGCGRADLLDFLLARGVRPDHYIGLEAVDELARAAEQKRHRDCTIVRGDFVQEPNRLFTGADAIVFSGSLNTLDPDSFYRTLVLACDAAVEAVIFNFLCSPHLAAAQYLTWHRREDVEAFCRSRGWEIAVLEDYLMGDCSVRVRKPAE